MNEILRKIITLMAEGNLTQEDTVKIGLIISTHNRVYHKQVMWYKNHLPGLSLDDIQDDKQRLNHEYSIYRQAALDTIKE